MSLSFHPRPNTNVAHLCWNFENFKRMSKEDFDRSSLEDRITKFTELMIFFIETRAHFQKIEIY